MLAKEKRGFVKPPLQLRLLFGAKNTPIKPRQMGGTNIILAATIGTCT